jgi:hypothetical protein
MEQDNIIYNETEWEFNPPVSFSATSWPGPSESGSATQQENPGVGFHTDAFPTAHDHFMHPNEPSNFDQSCYSDGQFIDDGSLLAASATHEASAAYVFPTDAPWSLLQVIVE